MSHFVPEEIVRRWHDRYDKHFVLGRPCCPACGVERADYEGPNGAHLEACPNCGTTRIPNWNVPRPAAKEQP